MNEDDIERFEEERELELYREYRDVLPMFQFVIETERRFYLANQVAVTHKPDGFVASVSVSTRRDVNVEVLRRDDPATIPEGPAEA